MSLRHHVLLPALVAAATVGLPAAGPAALFPILVDGRYGFIDRSGVVAVPPTFASVREFNDGLAPVLVGTQWGYVDGRGRLAIPARFDVAEPFADGLAAVRTAEGPAYIDTTGAIVIRGTNFSVVGRPSEGLIPVKVSGQWGFADRTGRAVIAPSYRKAFSFSEGLAAVQVGEKWGFIDRQGQVAIAPRFTGVGNFVDGVAPAAEAASWGLIDKRGEFVVPPRYAGIADVSEGLALFDVWGEEGLPLHGFMDATGRVRIPATADTVSRFYDGRALVRRGDRYGYLDASGALAIPARFSWARDFDKGLAEVEFTEGGRRLRGYVDPAGRVVWSGPAPR
jgi:hypothetical protein